MKKKDDKTPKKNGKKAERTPKAKAPKKTDKPAELKAKAQKKSSEPKRAPKLKAIKHDEKFELGVDSKGTKPIIIKGNRDAKPKRAKKELRRISSTGGFTAWDGRTGKTFATKQEAEDYAAEQSKKLGEKIEVTRTNRQVTHTFKEEETKK